MVVGSPWQVGTGARLASVPVMSGYSIAQRYRERRWIGDDADQRPSGTIGLGSSHGDPVLALHRGNGGGMAVPRAGSRHRVPARGEQGASRAARHAAAPLH